MVKSGLCGIVNTSTNRKENNTMTYYFEIRNTKTNECATATAKGMAQACNLLGWKVRECKCVYRAEVA